MTTVFNSYLKLVLGRPLIVLLLTGIAAWFAAAGLQHFSFTTDYRVFFGEGNPDLQKLEQIEHDFGRSESLLFALEPAKGDVFNPTVIDTIRRIEDEAWKLPYVRIVYALTNHYQAQADGDDILVEPLIPEGRLDLVDFDPIRKIALGNERLVNGLLSEDGRITGVVAYFHLPHENPEQEIADITAAANKIEASIEASQNIEVYQTGMVAFNNAMSEASNQDRDELFPLAYLLMFALIGVFFRGFAAIVGTVIVIIASATTGMGLACWLGIGFTSISMASFLIILTLAIADSVHILTSFEQSRHAGLEREAAMREALRVNYKAVFLTSFTTVLGFLSLNFNDSPPFQDLGNVVAMGVVAAFLYSTIALPALMMLLPLGQPRKRLFWQPVMDRFADVVIRAYKPLLLLGLAIIIGLAASIPRNEFGDNYIKFFDESIKFRADAEYINDHLTGMQQMEYAFRVPNSGDINEPAFLNNLKKFGDWLESQEEVRKVSSIVDLMQELNQAMHGDDPAWYRIPESRELAAQYLLLFELSLPQGADLTYVVNMEHTAARVTVLLESITSEEVVRFDDRAQAWMAENLPESMRERGSGVSVLFANIARRNFDSMILGTTLALIGISLTLILAFRSLKLGLVSLVPNLIPALMGFGIWGLMSGVVGMGLAVVTSLTLGIVVDDTVHMLDKYRRARNEKGLSAEDAVRAAFRSVGTALWITSAVLVAGFLMVASSSFTINAHLGMLTAIIISCALLADFLFLPPLLLLVDRIRNRA